MASEKRTQETVLSFSPSVAVERDAAKAHDAEFAVEEIDMAAESCVTVYGRMQP
jgi:hypothetical protein